MNFKTKAVGLLAGSALALSLAGGAIAQDGTTVQLIDGDCIVTATGANIDFGTYTFNGTSYVSDGNAVNSTLSLSATDNTVAGAGCIADIGGGQMANGLDTIDVLFDGSNPLNDVSVAEGTDTTTVAVTIDATSITSDDDPVTYNGTITISNSEAA